MEVRGAAPGSAGVAVATSGKGSILKRVCSMPRNPFQGSRGAKAGNGGGSNSAAASDGGNGKDSGASAHGDGGKKAEKSGIVPIADSGNGGDAGKQQPQRNASMARELPDDVAGGDGCGTGPPKIVSPAAINGGEKKLFRRLSVKKFINRIAQQMTYVSRTSNQKLEKVQSSQHQHHHPHGAPAAAMTGGGTFAWPPDTVPGVIGLRNHGNTCFMNAVLQCLSHTDILAQYFVLDQYKADLKRRNKINAKKFGTKGELTEQLALVLKSLWTCKDAPDYSSNFKAVVDRYGSQFRSSTQHDAQEFLFWLLDKVHEDLNTATKRKYKTIKNNGRSDEAIAAETLANYVRCNNSFVQAVFQAQFRSSLTCPTCGKQSNTFDPFYCLSVPLPQLSQQPVVVKVIYSSQQPKQVNLGLGIPHGSPVLALREQLHTDTGIAVNRMILTEICENGFSRVFCDSHQMSSIGENDPVYCIESPAAADGTESTQIVLCLCNGKRSKGGGGTVDADGSDIKRFGTPFCLVVNRDISYSELLKLLLKEMSTILKSDVFTFATPAQSLFKIRLQDPSCDAETYLEATVEHPLFTEMIDLALSVLPSDAGPPHVKLLLEWTEPEKFFSDMSDPFVEHESVGLMKEKIPASSTLTLEQCFEHYTKAETLGQDNAWKCPHCQEYLPVVKTLGLWSLPDIMVIHLKRFRQQQLRATHAAKLTNLVKFPLRGFDMTPHLARDPNAAPLTASATENDNWSPWRKIKRHSTTHSCQMDNRYDLYAVCYHQGDTLETGHYTAACKNPYDHQWYKFDDQRVTHVLNDCVDEEIINNEAYLLFYQRRKLDGSECSGSSSSSGVDHWVSKIAGPVGPSGTIERVKMVPVAVKPQAVETVATLAKADTDDSGTMHSSQSELSKELLPSANNDESSQPTATEDESPQPPKAPSQDATIDNQPQVAGDGSEESRTALPVDTEPPQSTAIDPPSPAAAVVAPASTLSPSSSPTTAAPRTEVNSPITPDAAKAKASDAVDGEDLSIKKPKKESPKPATAAVKFVEKQPLKRTEVTSTNNQNGGSGRFSLPTAQHYQDILWRESMSERMTNNHRPSSYAFKAYDNDAVSMIRGANTCSKDTLLFIDQPSSHGLDRGLDDDDDADDLIAGGRALWISPVTPHKLITVSPKN